MCLNTVSSLNLEYNKKEDCFVGYGYKKFDYRVTDNLGRINTSLLMKTTLKGALRIGKGWWEATGSTRNIGMNNEKTISSSDKKLYWPGFHIFLNEQDAREYRHNFGDVVKVMFSEVTSLGKNDTKSNYYGDCVIAKYMKVIEKV